MYKLIVSDLDETLINGESTVSEIDLAAIKRAQELGIRFVPATGRSFNDFQHILQLTGVHNQKDQYSISYNGGVITENCHNRLLTTTALPFNIAKEIFDIGARHQLLIHLFTLTGIHTLNVNQNEIDFLDDHVFLTLLDDTNIDHLKNDPILKINFQHHDMASLQEIERLLPGELKDLLDINYSSSRYLEFNPRGINKGNALRDLMALLDIQPEEVLGIGDNMNDRTLIDVAGTGVAVANAVPELKAKADYICQQDHQHHAVAEAINRFIFKE